MAVRTRNPMEICIFSVLTAASFGPATHLTPVPPTMQAAPPGVGRFAAVVLLIGCLLALVGIAWRRRTDGVVIEQLGCALTAFGCLFYVLALALADNWPTTAYAIGMSSGISILCISRYVQIDRWVKVHRRLNKTEAEAGGGP